MILVFYVLSGKINKIWIKQILPRFEFLFIFSSLHINVLLLHLQRSCGVCLMQDGLLSSCSTNEYCFFLKNFISNLVLNTSCCSIKEKFEQKISIHISCIMFMHFLNIILKLGNCCFIVSAISPIYLKQCIQLNCNTLQFI